MDAIDLGYAIVGREKGDLVAAVVETARERIEGKEKIDTGLYRIVGEKDQRPHRSPGGPFHLRIGPFRNRCREYLFPHPGNQSSGLDRGRCNEPAKSGGKTVVARRKVRMNCQPCAGTPGTSSTGSWRARAGMKGNWAKNWI